MGGIPLPTAIVTEQHNKTADPARSRDLVPPARFPYLSGLDGLRAVAVMAVLFYHAEFSWAEGGFLGVEVFFVISGYLITSLLLVEWLRTDTIDLKAFWLRRARRLLPAVFLLLGVVAVGSILFLRDSLYRLGADILAAGSYVTNWFLILRQDSYFEAFGRPPLLQHLWSLSVEEQFYVLWPILFSVGMLLVGGATKHATIRRFRWLVIAGVIGSTLLMGFLFTPFEDPSRVYYGTDTRAAGILIGVALALWWMPWRLADQITSRSKIWITGLGWAAFIGLIAVLANLNEFSPWLYRGGFAVTSILTATVIAVIAHPAVGFGRVLSNPVMNWIGTRSYGIYLWHWPIFMVTRPGFDVGTDHVRIFIARLALTFAIAEISYRFVESPIRRLGYRAWMRGITRSLGLTSPRIASGLAIAALGAFAMIAATLALQAGGDRPATVVASPAVDGDGTAEISVSEPTVDVATPPPSTITGSTTTSPETIASPTTAASSPTANPSAPSPTATTPLASATSQITLIGDSVLMGAEGAVLSTLGNSAVLDASVNRQFKHADDVARDLRDQGRLGDVVVIHLGTNGAFNSDTWDEVMTELDTVDRVIVLTAFVPRRWESRVNDAIRSGSEKWPDVEIIDYWAFGESHPEYYNDDGVHLNGRGQAAYAELIRTAIDR